MIGLVSIASVSLPPPPLVGRWPTMADTQVAPGPAAAAASTTLAAHPRPAHSGAIQSAPAEAETPARPALARSRSDTAGAPAGPLGRVAAPPSLARPSGPAARK